MDTTLKEVCFSDYYDCESYTKALCARQKREGRTVVNKAPKHTSKCRGIWDMIGCTADCEVDMIEIDKKLIGLLQRYEIKVTRKFPDDAYPVARLACYIPVWVWQLYNQCGGWKLHDKIDGPWSSIFKYAARRASEDDEFQHALAAALDAEVLVQFIQQQRYGDEPDSVRGRRKIWSR